MNNAVVRGRQVEFVVGDREDAGDRDPQQFQRGVAGEVAASWPSPCSRCRNEPATTDGYGPIEALHAVSLADAERPTIAGHDGIVSGEWNRLWSLVLPVVASGRLPAPGDGDLPVIRSS